MSTLRERLRGFETHIRTELVSRFYLLEPITCLSVKIRGFVEDGVLVYAHLLGEEPSSKNRVLKGIMLGNSNGGLKETVETCFAQFSLNAEPKPCDILTKDVMGMHIYYEIMDAIAELL